MTTLNLSPAGQDLHRRALVIDGLLWNVMKRPSGIVEGKDVIDRFVEAGITAGNQTLGSMPTDSFMDVLVQIYHYMSLVEIKPDKCLIVGTTMDILRAKRENRHGLILGLQGTAPIGQDLRLLTILHALGLRIVGLAYNFRHAWGDGCYEPHDGGLTAMGRAGVVELNRLGIVIDLSHVGVRTSLEAIELSRDPVVFSHSNVQKLNDHIRNVTDEEIRAIGRTGGVIGLSPHTVFTREDRTSSRRPTLDDLLRHLEHIVELAGIDHVGVGTDMKNVESLNEKIFNLEFGRQVTGFYGGIPVAHRFVEGFDGVFEFGNMTDRLLQRGYTEEQVLKVMGGNFLRVFKAVWDR